MYIIKFVFKTEIFDRGSYIIMHNQHSGWKDVGKMEK